MKNHLTKLSQQGFGFAVFPEVHIYDAPGGKTIQHLIFGDYITSPKTKAGARRKWSKKLTKVYKKETWINVRSRQENGWIRLNEIQLERILEVNFVDIGQGDGCHLVTPADEHFIIDAGKFDNMYRFLRWRFNLSKDGPELPEFNAIISHPDEDHWKGFELFLSNIPPNQKRQITFKRIYHNGIIQRYGSKIGEVYSEDGIQYLDEFVETKQDVSRILKLKGKKSNLEKMLIEAVSNYPDISLDAIYKVLGHENYIYEKYKGLSIEVLAPIPELINGRKMLRWFDPDEIQIGKTKNGHSVVLVAKIGKIKVLLGGDLNSKSADYLMEKYSGQDIRRLRLEIENAQPLEKPELEQQMTNLINVCRLNFACEVAKSCHHGSHDITNELLSSIYPIATIISSGDEESFCHPRPETLGAIGKYSRGERPLIYSTELSRSSPEFVKIIAKKEKTDKTKQRIVSTYGMITLRTDGYKAIISQKLEKNRSNFGKITKWQIDKLIWNEEREEFVSKK